MIKSREHAKLGAAVFLLYAVAWTAIMAISVIAQKMGLVSRSENAFQLDAYMILGSLAAAVIFGAVAADWPKMFEAIEAERRAKTNKRQALEPDTKPTPPS